MGNIIFLGKLVKYALSLRKSRKLLREVEFLFKSGTYKFKQLNKIYLYKENDLDAQDFIKKNFEQMNREYKKPIVFKEKFKKIIAEVSKVEVRNNNIISEYKSTLLMVTQDNFVKAFDFQNNKVHTFIGNEKEYLETKQNYIYVSEHFLTPFETHDDNNNVITEKIINFIVYREWNYDLKDKVADQVFKDYIRYFTKLSSVNPVIKTKEEFFEESKIRISLSKDSNINLNSHSCLVKEDLPKYFINGDLYFNNLLYDGTIYYIDWEYAGYYTFFFDIIHLIFVEAAMNKDSYYLNKFLNGEYDLNFERLFKSVGLKYNPHLKFTYILEYSLEALRNYEKKLTNENFEHIYQNYKDKINEIYYELSK